MEIGTPISPTGKLNVFSSTWHYIQEYCVEKRQSLREDNDSEELTETETAIIRGRIAELTDIIELGGPPQTEKGYGKSYDKSY